MQRNRSHQQQQQQQQSQQARRLKSPIGVPMLREEIFNRPTSPLVESCQHLLQSNGSIIGKDVARVVCPRFPSFLEALPQGIAAAIKSTDGRQPTSHNQIRQLIDSLANQLLPWKGQRVALILPNGPELALSILALSTYCSCVPLNAFGATQELQADVQAAGCVLVIGLSHSVAETLAQEVCLPFGTLVPDTSFAGLFTLQLPPPQEITSSSSQIALINQSNSTTALQEKQHKRNTHNDEILVLFTSGTTGGKKLVPHTWSNVLVATACIAVSWQLTPADMNCNLMPLFHIGGIIRQVFASLLSGGGVICCPSFDPTLFWMLHLQQQFTWYYAAPTMHQVLLETAPKEDTIVPPLRMIANAAGGLLPSLARQLRHVFQAHVLPSYGMTECMPITSPPANYQLEKPGTSGVAVGPELSIRDLEGHDMGIHQEGPICVRGEPCFHGYGTSTTMDGGEPDKSPFLPGGWFNTGDLGYLDAEGYLYITGRSKEVINRGGEIISPLEVEEAVNGHPDIAQCVAFSTTHNVLQEVVGMVLVPQPNRPRIDLPSLHEYLGQGRLAAPKWPQCIVYMEGGVPKSNTNKLLRVKLGQRLSLPEIHDNMHWVERTFQATCPPPGTSVSTQIPCERVKIDADAVQKVLHTSLVTEPMQAIAVIPHPTRLGSLVAYSYRVDRVAIVKCAQEKLDAYAVPSHVCELNVPLSELMEWTPPQHSDAIAFILQEAQSRGQGPTDPLIMELQELFQNLLDLDCLPAPASNFFNLGGSSMMASQLASRIRKLHNVPFGGAEVFHHSSCEAIAVIIRERRNLDAATSASVATDPAASAASSLFSKKLDLKNTPFEQTRLDHFSPTLATNLFQALPLCVFYPTWQLTRFFLFFKMLLKVLETIPGEHNLVAFVFTLVVFHLLWVTLTPLLFVAIKWTVIGRYEKGRYPIWGNMYLRWWFVDVMRKLIGRGAWGSHEVSLNWFYRLLGAKIGHGVRISLEADVAEYDLVDIRDGAAIEYATVRGFGVDNGAMILGPVSVGTFASVGARSVVAPYTSIPDGAHLGPVTSSYEINASIIDEDKQHYRYNRRFLPQPNFWYKTIVVGIITFIVDTISHIPALLVLYWMVTMPWHHNEHFNSVNDMLEWLCDFRRIPFYIGLRVARAVAAPLFYMASSILVKRFVIGKFQPGPRDTTSQWQLIRHELAASLFSRENMQECTELLGRHYELVSCLYRLLGAKIGERVFWPGHQPIFTGEFDLLEIGDDVVFGSRSALFCTTIESCEKIQLCAGSNVSDNTVVLPGSIIGKNAVLGSNSVCPAYRYLPEGSVWFGARGGDPVLLEKGVEEVSRPIDVTEVDARLLQMTGDESTLRPFGRAFYHGEAPYFVWSLSLMIVYTFLVKVLIAAVHTVPLLGALHLSAGYLYGWSLQRRNYQLYEVPFSHLYFILVGFYIITHFIRLVLWVLIEVGAKWLFMGQRKEGRYNWDQTDYGQNWELYQIVTKIRSFGRNNFVDFIAGTPFIVSFFRWQGSEVGKDCCLYPAGGDPYMPEPDLVVMGDRVVLDCSSVVCHLNTRGNFELVKIVMENNVTLRTRSRIQQGVYMEHGSMLLEKSLAMTGEIIEADSVWQGAPASRILSYDNSSIGSRPSTDFEAGVAVV